MNGPGPVRILLHLILGTIVAGLLCLGGIFAWLSWAIPVTHSPDLSPAEAGALISARPEFSNYAKLIEVSSTTRGGDSLKDCCYSGEFTFRQFGSGAIIRAGAEFRYDDDGKWHLMEFSYGDPPHVETVWVGQNDQPSPK
jgi:hypothetical protein